MAYKITQVDIQTARETEWGKLTPAQQLNLRPNVAIGVQFPFTGNGVFKKSFTTLEQAKTNFMSLILTTKGDRYMEPDFGTDLAKAVFEPNNPGIKKFIVETITQATNYWLPYLSITKFDIVTNEEDPNLNHKIKISLGFTVTGNESEQEITIFAGDEGIKTEAVKNFASNTSFIPT